MKNKSNPIQQKVASLVPKVLAINKLLVGDILVNLGLILEIEERDSYYWIVIERMNERQVWRFYKTDELLIL